MRHPNRIKAMAPRKIKVWCACDRSLIQPGGKCKVCGWREPHRRLKK